MIVDVHAHLDFDQFSKDLDQVISRAKKAKVVSIINNGVDVKTNRSTLELSSKYGIVNAALGFYPIEALEAGIDSVKKEIDFIKLNSDKIIAVGEIGIDLKHSRELDKQVEIFRLFLDLARSLDKPVIVHSRQAEDSVVKVLEEKEMKKVVMHCFNGSMELVSRCEKNGWFFSVPPVIVRSMHFQQLVGKVSMGNLLTETDSPFLAPPPKVRNEPAFIVETISKIAELKSLDVSEVEKMIFANYQRVFS